MLHNSSTGGNNTLHPKGVRACLFSLPHPAVVLLSFSTSFCWGRPSLLAQGLGQRANSPIPSVWSTSQPLAVRRTRAEPGRAGRCRSSEPETLIRCGVVESVSPDDKKRRPPFLRVLYTLV